MRVAVCAATSTGPHFMRQVDVLEQYRADLKHLRLDPVLWAGPHAAIGCGLCLATKQLSTRRY